MSTIRTIYTFFNKFNSVTVAAAYRSLTAQPNVIPQPERIEGWNRDDSPASRIAGHWSGDSALFSLVAEYYRSLTKSESSTVQRHLLKQIIEELEDLLFADDEKLFEVGLSAQGNPQREALQLIAELDALLGAEDVPSMTWAHALDRLIVWRVQQ
jgi:hypothetical protein